MDLQKIALIVEKKVCPLCNRGMMIKTGRNVYVCDYGKCREEFDLSRLSENELNALLKKARETAVLSKERERRV